MERCLENLNFNYIKFVIGESDSRFLTHIMLQLVALFLAVAADLPVHCLYKQVLGDWTFELEGNTFTADLHNEKTYCGHGQPDQVQHLPNVDFMFQIEKPEYISVRLSEPNLASSPQLGSGTWTMIYDEGFIINFGTKTFFNYFYYCDDKAPRKHISVCDKTMKGWYSNPDPQDHSNWGCWFGYKDYVPTEGPKEDKPTEAPGFKWVQPTTEFLETGSSKLTSFIETKTEEKRYEDQTEFVEMLNQSQSTWTAGINSNFKGMTFAQVNEKSGIKKTKERERPASPAFVQTSRTFTDSECESLKSKYSFDLRNFKDTKIQDISTHCLPEEWDWTNINGISYVPPISEQGDCGSCYIMSVVEMLTARLQIQSNNEHKPQLSPQYVVSCNFYTEGCDGGYPTLVNKFISEFDLVTESCFPFTATNQSCKNVCASSSEVYSVSDYYYIGGYYGASDEERMMKEIRARGPIIGNFEPPMDFSYYTSGIYQKVSNREESPINLPNTEDMRDVNIQWEKVDHSVLIVGWGVEEDGTKFWKVQNSWGTDWGEDGFFRIKRGTDECAIESMGEAAVPYIK